MVYRRELLVIANQYDIHSHVNHVAGLKQVKYLPATVSQVSDKCPADSLLLEEFFEVLINFDEWQTGC